MRDIPVDETQVEWWHIVSRIGLRPEFIDLARLFQVPCNALMVVRLNVQPLPLAPPISQLVGLQVVLRRQTGFPKAAVSIPEQGIRHGEVLVKADGPLGQGHRGGKLTICQGLVSLVVGLKCFEQWCSGLLDRCVELLNRTQRFAQLLSEICGPAAQSIEDLFLAYRLHLLLCQRIARGTVHRSEPNHVIVSQICNRAPNVSLASRTLTEVPRNFGGKTCLVGLTHEAQSLLDLLVRDEAEERRLFELHS